MSGAPVHFGRFNRQWKDVSGSGQLQGGELSIYGLVPYHYSANFLLPRSDVYLGVGKQIPNS
jgi:hypothetical protein